MKLKSLSGAVALVVGLLLFGHPSFIHAQDCDENGMPDVAEIAADAGLDCDTNGMLDSCEIDDDSGLDCDANGMLDSCEIDDDPGLDCDTNGMLDSCEIDDDAGLDCDANDILDECELGGNDCNSNGILDACDISGVEDDCDGNGVPDSCELGDNDCNSNGTLDACDISEGDEDDCDENGIPDVCEIEGEDCNSNGIPDACELQDGGAQDCNLNGIPDECDLEAGAEDCNDNGVPDECDVQVGVDFGPPANVDVNRNPVFLLAADVDDDDDLDLISGSLSALEVPILTNDGNGNFAQTASYAVGSSPHSVTAADFDGDENLDLATANERAVADHITILVNDGAGTFVPKNVTLGNGMGVAPSDIVAGDIDGDEDVDLVVTSFRSDLVSIIANDGAGNFTVVQTFAAGDFAYRVEIADLDDDGDLDLAVANTDSNDVSLFSNDGTGVFTPAGTLQPGRGPNWVMAVDIDGDEDTDLVTSNEDSETVAIFLNTGTGEALGADTFTSALSFPAGPDAVSVKAGDVDEDGDLDLVVANNFDSTTVSILVNSGNLAFSVPVPLVTGDGPRWVVFQNLDGDDRLDLGVANRHGDTVSILANSSTPPESEDCNGDGVPDECDVDCNGNGIADSCDIVSGSSSDCDSDLIPDDCQDDCNENGIPDGCDVSDGTSEDTNQNGTPDECDPPVETVLEGEPEEVVIDNGIRAVAFVATMTATNPNEDSVWNSATFENVDTGDASNLVNEARLYLDTNGNKMFDEDDEQLGSGEFTLADNNRVTLQNLQTPLPTSTAVTYFLVFELKTPGGSAFVFPGIRLPGGWTSPGLLLLFALCLLLLGKAAVGRSLRRIPGYITSAAAVLIVAGLLAPGCSSSSSGGGGGAPPAESRQLQMQLTALDITGAQSGEGSVTPGLPLTAWSFEA